MKKILLLIALTGMFLGAISCSDDDEPRKGNGIVNLNSLMVNHVYNPHSDEVLELASTRNKLVIDTLKHQATLEFSYNDGTGDNASKHIKKKLLHFAYLLYRRDAPYPPL